MRITGLSALMIGYHSEMDRVFFFKTLVEHINTSTAALCRRISLSSNLLYLVITKLVIIDWDKMNIDVIIFMFPIVFLSSFLWLKIN